VRIENLFYKEIASLRDKHFGLTDYVDESEHCLFLQESVRVGPPKGLLPGQYHRYERILVHRNDALSEWWFDLGLNADFESKLFQMPCFWLHTVGEARECAMAKRAGLMEKVEYEPRDLWGEWYDQLEQQALWASGTSTSGPYISVGRT
jgi:hypothetical protein